MKINYGCGRQRKTDYVGIDQVQYIDGRGNQMVDKIVDVEKDVLPFEDNTVEHVIAENVFEHLGDGFIFALNELHRVMQKDGRLVGMVPIAGTKVDFMDITHKRHFIIESFNYICGENKAMANRPSHPRYADYGVLPWKKNELFEKDNLIYFNLSPKK
jgi:predicted SAM-dependent methyltransferase